MTIRTFETGDESALVSIYNEAAADLPRFKAATLDDVRRRCNAPGFDPGSRFLALAGGRPVGYAQFQPSGRVNFPWCRKGHEHFAVPLLTRCLGALKERGHARARAAYAADWGRVHAFLVEQGFAKARDVVNFVLDLVDMPTPAARAGSHISPLTAEDLPAVLALGARVLRSHTPDELATHLFANPYFPPGSSFALRSRANGAAVAVGLCVTNPAYAHPKQVDASMPCYRLGAFGTEGESTKRINGLFSFLAPDRDVSASGLDLLAYATVKLESTQVESLGAQAPSDAPHLLRFYSSFFRRQGSFPEFEKAL